MSRRMHGTVKQPESFYERPAALALILALTAVAFSLSLRNGFVWDDWQLMVPNPVYRNFRVIDMLTTRANGLEYLPVRDLTLAVDFAVWGERPFGYHLTNLILYLLTLPALAGTVSRIVRYASLEKRGMIVFWTTLLFALHPLHAEAVNFIAARNSILAALFLFLSCNFFMDGIEQTNWRRIALSLLMFLLALFSKASVVFYPLFLSVLLTTIPGRSTGFRGKFAVLALFFAVDAGAVAVHVVNAAATGIMNENTLRFGMNSTPVSIVKALQIPFFYLGKMLVPYPLTVEYAQTFTGARTDLYALAAGIGTAGLVVLAWRMRNRAPFVSYGTAFFFLSLIPVLNLIPVNPVVADRYAFFAVLGPLLPVAAWSSNVQNHRKVLVASLVAVLLLWAGIDVVRSRDWRSDVALWESALSADPSTHRISLADALWREGRFTDALAALREERERSGTYYYSLYEGKYYLLSGKYEPAIEALNRALVEGGDAAKEPHLELGRAYEMAGRPGQAYDQYLRVLETVDADPLGRIDKSAEAGLTRLQPQLIPNIDELASRARLHQEDAGALTKYAVALHELGRYEEAEHWYRKALEREPTNWALWYNSALTYMKRHRCGEALPLFERALAFNASNRDLLNNTAICCMTLRQYADAEHYFLRALDFNPSFFYAAFNLGRLYFLTGDRAKSGVYFRRAKALAAGNEAVQRRVEQYLNQLQ